MNNDFRDYSNYLQHFGTTNERKNHKYVARIEEGTKNGHKQYRYFYSNLEYKAYLVGQKVKQGVKDFVDYKVTGDGYVRDAKAKMKPEADRINKNSQTMQALSKKWQNYSDEKDIPKKLKTQFQRDKDTYAKLQKENMEYVSIENTRKRAESLNKAYDKRGKSALGVTKHMSKEAAKKIRYAAWDAEYAITSFPDKVKKKLANTCKDFVYKNADVDYEDVLIYENRADDYRRTVPKYEQDPTTKVNYNKVKKYSPTKKSYDEASPTTVARIKDMADRGMTAQEIQKATNYDLETIWDNM